MHHVRLTILRIAAGALLCLCGLGAVGQGGEFFGSITPQRREELKAEVQGVSDTSEKLWGYIEKAAADLKKPVAINGESNTMRNQAEMTLLEERKLRMVFACQAFLEAFPMDPHRTDAQALLLQRQYSLSRGQFRDLYESIIASTDASPETRHDARVCQTVDAIGAMQADFKAADKILSDFEHDYPDDPRGADFVEIRMRYFADKRPEDLIVALAALISSPNKATAAKASDELTLRIDPIDLRAKAVNGRAVDIAQYRGKIVLLVFWAATWGNPQENILPQVLAARKKFAPADFQIVGICNDVDRKAMLRAIKAQNMDWPTINDAREASGGSAIATRFRFTSTQGAWLLDREGVGHPLPRGANLDEEIAKAIRLTMPKK